MDTRNDTTDATAGSTYVAGARALLYIVWHGSISALSLLVIWYTIQEGFPQLSFICGMLALSFTFTLYSTYRGHLQVSTLIAGLSGIAGVSIGLAALVGI